MINEHKKFGKQQRLSNKNDYDRVFQFGSRESNKYFSLITKANDIQFPRIGIVVSKRAVKNSFQRNKIKRLIRECFRKSCKTLSFDYVLLAKPLCIHASNKVLFDSINSLLNN